MSDNEDDVKVTSDGHKGLKRKRTKKEKEKDAPKGPRSAYLIFSVDKRRSVAAEQPDLAFGQIAKQIGVMWHNASEEDKAYYNGLAQMDKQRYEEEMAAFHEKKAKKRKKEKEKEKEKAKEKEKERPKEKEKDKDKDSKKSKKKKKDKKKKKKKKHHHHSSSSSDSESSSDSDSSKGGSGSD